MAITGSTLRFAERQFLALGAPREVIEQAKRFAKEELDRQILKHIGTVDYVAVYRYYEPQAPNFPMEGATPRQSVIAEAIVTLERKA